MLTVVSVLVVWTKSKKKRKVSITRVIKLWFYLATQDTVFTNSVSLVGWNITLHVLSAKLRLIKMQLIRLLQSTKKCFMTVQTQTIKFDIIQLNKF